MYPTTFEYLEPGTLDDVLALLQKYGDEARILAGGQSLVPLMKLRLVRPEYLIDLNRVPDLRYIRELDGCLCFGTLARHVDIQESVLVEAELPMMRQAAGRIGDTQVRNMGTIGGAIVEADPAGDWGPVILALNARIKCVGPAGARELCADEFFTSAYTTALGAAELITEIAVPIPDATSVGTYLKLERVAGDFAITSVALQMDIGKDGMCREVGIGLGGADEKPVKAASVEELLRGKVVSPDVVEAATQRIRAMADPIGDVRGSAEYKREVLAVLFRRALEEVTGQVSA